MSRNNYLSASKFELATHCQYPWADGVTWPDDEVGEPALVGSAVHKLLELTVAHEQSINAEDIESVMAEYQLPQELRPRVVALLDAGEKWLADVGVEAASAAAEVAMRYDQDIDRVDRIGRGVGREYGSTEHLYGTADLVWQSDEHTLHVADYKTGREAPPADCWQGAVLCMLAWAAGSVELTHVHCHIVHLRDDGSYYDDVHVYDVDDIELIGDEIAGLMRSDIAGSQPKPGHHCTALYCPLRAVCPATTKAMATLDDEGLSATIRDAEHAAWTLHRLAAVKSAVDAIDKALRAWADTHGPIEAGDKLWGPRVCTKETIDLAADGAIASLVDGAGLTQEQLDAVAPRSTTKTALTKALGKGKAADALMALAQAGAIRTSEYTRYESRKRPKQR